MRRLVALAAVSALAACEPSRQAAQRLQSLVDEGEVYLYLDPFPAGSERLTFSIASISAARADGGEVPLEVALTEISGSEMTRQRLLAWGRLPPGSYGGFLLTLQRAALTTDEGTAALLVSQEPSRIEAGFSMVRGRAAVVQLGYRSRSVDRDFAFGPSFSAGVLAPANTIAQLAGYCSNAATADVTVFDKHAHRVVAVVPAGREPQGLALDPRAGRLYVALAAEDQIQIIDLATGEELRRIPLQVGDGPREIALTPDGQFLVSANAASNTASFVDPSSGVVLARIQTGMEPAALLLDRQGRRAYVFDRRSSEITVLDLGNRSVAATIRTDAEPIRGQINRAGTRLYVIHAGSAYLNVYSLPDLSLASRLFVGLGVSAIKVDPRTDLLYLGRRDEARIQIYDPLSLLPIDFIDVPDAVSYLTIDDVENTLVSLMAERRIGFVELTSKRLLSVIDVGREPYQVTVVGERY